MPTPEAVGSRGRVPRATRQRLFHHVGNVNTILSEIAFAETEAPNARLAVLNTDVARTQI